jgi:hypothetical protein
MRIRYVLYAFGFFLLSISTALAAEPEMPRLAQTLAQLITYRVDDLCGIGEPCDYNLSQTTERGATALLFLKRRESGGGIEIFGPLPLGREIFRPITVTIAPDGSVTPEKGGNWDDVVTTLLNADGNLLQRQQKENERLKDAEKTRRNHEL